MKENDYGPVYLLALDGGGIRGICELRILHEMMTRIQKVKNLTDLPKPCDYFHLMAGKSTGGFIVILLSRLKMTTKEAIDLYYELSSRIFSRKNKRTWWGRLLGLHEFDPKALEEIIKELVDSRGIGGLMLDDDTSHLPKAFVCSQNAYDQGVPVRFRTYEPPSAREVIPGGLSRTHHISLPSSTPLLSSSSVGMSMIGIPEEGGVESTSPVPDDLWDEYRDIRIWEAARATTAAPSYFPPMSIVRGNETRTFIDGAMGCNNPSFELVHEAIALYGPRRVLGCLISLGTGSSGPLTIGTRKGLRGFRDLLTNIKRLATDSESVHRGLQSQMRPVLNTYFRFQLPNGTENIKLHHYEKLDELSKLTEAYIKNKSSEIDKVVSILVGNARPRGISLGQIARSDYAQISLFKEILLRWIGIDDTNDEFYMKLDLIRTFLELHEIKEILLARILVMISRYSRCCALIEKRITTAKLHLNK